MARGAGDPQQGHPTQLPQLPHWLRGDPRVAEPLAREALIGHGRPEIARS